MKCFYNQLIKGAQNEIKLKDDALKIELGNITQKSKYIKMKQRLH